MPDTEMGDLRGTGPGTFDKVAGPGAVKIGP